MASGDFGTEGIERLQEFWDRYRRVILGGLGALAAVVIIAFFTLRARNEASAAAAGRLAEASLQFWQGNYQASLAAAQQVAGQYGGTPAGTDALRLMGDDQYWLGQFKDAAESYRKYLRRQKTGLLADAVRRSLAYALESNRQFDEAAKIYLELAGRLDRESAADCLMGAARCYRATGNTREAADLYRRVSSDYGETSRARAARLSLAEITVPSASR
jgi:TolA-binding protein